MTFSEYDDTSVVYDCEDFDHQYEYDSDYDTVTTVSTVNSKKRKKKETKVPELPGVYTITKVIDGIKTKIRVHETKERVNARMVNAITGYPYYDDGNKRYKYLVGSKQEDDLFKVKMLAGLPDGKTALLFYESPDQYERHMHCTLNDKIKQKWLEKNQSYRRLLSIEEKYN